ncbi:MAG TPA: DMT family transporter [Ramlibacter sp.]|jgi:drug/metabolite transporter (DMT)-like permease|uniref:DMT family transporter n=1 Tax=Ramlibacter sp. TaxID=1917967 RepID=UPI002D3791C4|nr:DMT family transporter [Ramlibacter sp.]HZY20568.1 DMT family transporter [Ramlibacter sp.]
MLTGVLAGLGAGALWGLVFVAPRMVAGYSPVDLTAGRYAAYGALAAVLMVSRLRRRPLPSGAQALAAAGMSLLGFTGYYLLLVLAVRDSGTEVPTLVIGTIPVWVMLLGKPGHLRWQALAPGLLLTLLGLALMVQAPEAGAAALPHFWRGVLLAIAALVCWTAFAVLNAAWLRRHPDVEATDWANWLGLATGAGALLLWVAAGSPARDLAAQPDRALFVLLAVATGVGSAWLATILWNIASRRLSVSLCGQLIVSETLFALLYSFAWDGHWPGPSQLAAALLFTLGILASIKAHR